MDDGLKEFIKINTEFPEMDVYVRQENEGNRKPLDYSTRDWLPVNTTTNTIAAYYSTR